jgi:hypothetical protein
VEALLEVSGMNLPVNPMFILRMGNKVPGSYTAAEILAAQAKHAEASAAGGGCMAGHRGGKTITGRTEEHHVDASAAGGGCMAGQRGGNTITGRTEEHHVDACAGGGGSMAGQHGGNTITGRTPEQHAKSSGGRASLHEDAINILFANWDALPRTWTPTGSRQSVKRDQTCERESRLVDHVLSYYYDEKVGSLQQQTKVHKAGRYNTHFKYKAGDPGFIVAAADDRGVRAKSAQTR